MWDHRLSGGGEAVAVGVAGSGLACDGCLSRGFDSGWSRARGGCVRRDDVALANASGRDGPDPLG